mgnify:CR=1 FL=1
MKKKKKKKPLKRELTDEELAQVQEEDPIELEVKRIQEIR